MNDPGKRDSIWPRKVHENSGLERPESGRGDQLRESCWNSIWNTNEIIKSNPVKWSKVLVTAMTAVTMTISVLSPRWIRVSGRRPPVR